MSWQLGPVVRGIRGHRSAAVLVALQFGLGLAITIIAALVGNYFRTTYTPKQIAIDADLIVIELQLSGRDPNLAARRAAALADIEATPGCVGATIVDRVPLHSLEVDLDDVTIDGKAFRAAAFQADANVARVTGLKGAVPSFEKWGTGPVTPAIVSPAFAEALGSHPIGMRFVSRANGPAVVVGVADLRNHLFGANELTAIYAMTDVAPRTVVIARSEPGAANALRAALEDRLRRPGQHATIAPALDHLAYFASPIRAVLALLASIVGTIVLVVLMGSMGLTYFLVSARTREIGLRRAMGATRRDIVRYFVVEAGLLASTGVVLALGIVAMLIPTLFYEQDDFVMSWPLVAAVVAVVVGLDLIATLIPARKAAAVPPVVASRST